MSDRIETVIYGVSIIYAVLMIVSHSAKIKKLETELASLREYVQLDEIPQPAEAV